MRPPYCSLAWILWSPKAKNENITGIHEHHICSSAILGHYPYLFWNPGVVQPWRTIARVVVSILVVQDPSHPPYPEDTRSRLFMGCGL